MEPASTSRPRFEIIWESDLWAWLTGDLLSKQRYRLDLGQYPVAQNTRSKISGTRILGGTIFGAQARIDKSRAHERSRRPATRVLLFPKSVKTPSVRDRSRNTSI